VADFVTDTHGLIWYLQDNHRLGPQALAAFEGCDQGENAIYVPTISLVEIVYLQEKGRIPSALGTQFNEILRAETTGLRLADLTIEVVTALDKIPRTAVPDMPDRIVAATALSLGMPLITRDSRIRAPDLSLVW
jgi:PIN domain nuclease of toxin-antitoxin system